PTIAYLLAKKGYRVVSVSGELFEPDITSMCLDFGSKISELTEAIILRDSIGGMRQSISSLDGLIRRKTEHSVTLKSKLNELEQSVIRSEAKIDNINGELDYLHNTTTGTHSSLNELDSNYNAVLSEKNQLNLEIEKYQTRLSLVNSTLGRISQEVKLNEDNDYKVELDKVISHKNQIVKLIEATDFDLRQQITSSTPLKTEVDHYTERVNSIDEEVLQLENETSKKNVEVTELQKIVKSIESEIQMFRDQEQQSIDVSGTS